MKLFAARAFGRRCLSSLLLLFLIFGGISKPADAATFYYTGPAFSAADCESVGYSPSACTASGSITGTFTVRDSDVATGLANPYFGSITSWTMTSSVGTLSSSSGNYLGGWIYFVDGQPVEWE